MDNKVIEKSEIFKIVSDPTRLRILEVLFSSKKDMCVSEISEIIGMSQSATSHQLAKLEDKGIVECFRHGQMMCYLIKESKISSFLKKIICELDEK